jgi:hypothetical protein
MGGKKYEIENLGTAEVTKHEMVWAHFRLPEVQEVLKVKLRATWQHGNKRTGKMLHRGGRSESRGLVDYETACGGIHCVHLQG